MENEIAYLKTEDGLEFRLTNEKLFITSISGTETFALRSLNGIGVVDQLAEYNAELAQFKKDTQGFKNLLILSAVIVVVGIGMLTQPNLSESAGVAIGGGIFGGVLSYFRINKVTEPQMKSVVRLMLNGMNRDVQFNKRNVNSTDVANFVARVEDTLTAFHKN